MNYMDLEREMRNELRNVECNVEKSLSYFLFSCSSERDNSKYLRPSQMGITSSTISSVMELRCF